MIFSETVEFTTLIYHANTSMAEGYPTRIRVLSPNYFAFTTSDTFTTNYTLSGDLVAPDDHVTIDPMLPNGR